MSEATPPVGEDDLHAYIDGQLEVSRRHAVERHLAENPEAARRVAAYQAQREALRAAFATRTEEPLPPRLTLASIIGQRSRRRRTPWPGCRVHHSGFRRRDSCRLAIARVARLKPGAAGDVCPRTGGAHEPCRLLCRPPSPGRVAKRRDGAPTTMAVEPARPDRCGTRPLGPRLSPDRRQAAGDRAWRGGGALDV
jgi:anti-sigma factor RsiW